MLTLLNAYSFTSISADIMCSIHTTQYYRTYQQNSSYLKTTPVSQYQIH